MPNPRQRRTELFANEPMYGAKGNSDVMEQNTLNRMGEINQLQSNKLSEGGDQFSARIFRIGGCVMNASKKIKTLQDAKRSEMYSSETYGNEYGVRAERANVIKFILAIFGTRTNKKVRERREINTM